MALNKMNLGDETCFIINKNVNEDFFKYYHRRFSTGLGVDK